VISSSQHNKQSKMSMCIVSLSLADAFQPRLTRLLSMQLVVSSHYASYVVIFLNLVVNNPTTL